jgi:hypothetical protein
MSRARLLAAAVLIASCAIDERSDQYRCAESRDCSDGRVCRSGWCVTAGEVDAGAALEPAPTSAPTTAPTPAPSSAPAPGPAPSPARGAGAGATPADATPAGAPGSPRLDACRFYRSSSSHEGSNESSSITSDTSDPPWDGLDDSTCPESSSRASPL